MRYSYVSACTLYDFNIEGGVEGRLVEVWKE